MSLKIVVLNDFPLFPQNHGGKVRLINIYKRLAQKFQITYLCYSESGRYEKLSISDNFTMVAIQAGRLNKHIAKCAARIFGCSIDDILAMFLSKYDRKFCDAARKYIDEADVVICSHPYMYPVVKKYAGDKPIIYESVNVECVLKESLLKGGIFKKLATNSVKKVEGELVKKARLGFVTSSTDLEQLKHIYGVDSTKFHISPNGTDVASYDIMFEGGRLHKDKLIDPPLAVFLGSGHPPNVEAAMTIVEKIAPATDPVYFLLCGSVCYLVNRDAVGKNVGLAYMVSDDEKIELSRCADIALNPMLSGSGTNLKMLDYMAAGLPVITTPVGARGLDLENGRHAIICEIDEFPAKIREIMADKALYDRLSSEGRKLVEDHYDWGIISQNMAETIESELKK